MAHRLGMLVAALGFVVGCGGNHGSGGAAGGGSGGSSGNAGGTSGAGGGSNGNPSGSCTVPSGGQAVDSSHPTTVVGSGTAASCTADAVVAAVHAGGVVTFACGAAPRHDRRARDRHLQRRRPRRRQRHHRRRQPRHAERRRQEPHPLPKHLRSDATLDDVALPGAGHAASRRAELRRSATAPATPSRRAASSAAARSTSAAAPSRPSTFASRAARRRRSGRTTPAAPSTRSTRRAPSFVVGSTFDGEHGSNGGALGSIGTSWTIVNSVFSGNKAVGIGENPARAGTPGGGLGGAIYNDGDGYTLTHLRQRLRRQRRQRARLGRRSSRSSTI